MINSIDHIVIHVSDLERAMADYRELGFTVIPGGEHADGNSHNALITFLDGSYLELIAFKRTPPPDHLFAAGAARGEGIIAYALLPTDIEADVAGARERGLDLAGPYSGGRLRPDSVRLEWQTARARTPDLPFLCGDVTPRELRVPGGEAARHENGVVGILSILVVVESMDASASSYRALLDIEPLTGATRSGEPTATFTLAGSTITLVEPSTGAAFDYLRKRGEGPHLLTLQKDSSTDTITLDPKHTHGANIVVTELTSTP